MDTALETPASKELTNLTPEQQRRLEMDRRGGSKYPTIPQIKLANKDETRAPEGEYFIETKKGEDAVEVRCIGPNPEIIPLYKTVTYSYFDSTRGEKGELVAWTSDIHGYKKNPVTLYLKDREGNVTIDFDGTYDEFKDHRVKFDKKDHDGKKIGNNLKRKHILYVLFEGNPHKMIVSEASCAGVEPNGKPSFDTVQRHSLEYYLKMCWNDSKALYDFAITMGSKLVREKKDDMDNDPNVIYAKVKMPFYIMQFQAIRKVEEGEVANALVASMNTENAIHIIDESRKRDALAAEQQRQDEEERKKHELTPEDAAETFGEEVVSDLDA